MVAVLMTFVHGEKKMTPVLCLGLGLGKNHYVKLSFEKRWGVHSHFILWVLFIPKTVQTLEKHPPWRLPQHLKVSICNVYSSVLDIKC